MSTASNRMTSQERRTAIIQVAVKLFSERGFRGTTTRQLAAAVGLSEPVLYQHFETKRDLYKAMIEARMEHSEERWRVVLQPLIEEQDDAGFFGCLAQMITDWHLKDSTYMRLLLFSALEGHELADLFYQHQVIRKFTQVVVDYIRERIQAGAFHSSADPELAARAFCGMIANQALAAGIFHCEESRPTPESIRQMVELFLGGLRVR